MLQKMEYINQIWSDGSKEIITKNNITFYQRKFVIKSNEEIMTLILSSMDKASLEIINKPNNNNNKKVEEQELNKLSNDVKKSKSRSRK